jgi:hypothetical protein
MNIYLLYHEVVDQAEFSSSRFPGGDANVYKTARLRFDQILR